MIKCDKVGLLSLKQAIAPPKASSPTAPVPPSSFGAPGSKTLSDFLIDAKVDPTQRKRVAVLCDQLGPIWVIGHRIDDRVKLTELTRRILHLRARPLER